MSSSEPEPMKALLATLAAVVVPTAAAAQVVGFDPASVGDTASTVTASATAYDFAPPGAATIYFVVRAEAEDPVEASARMDSIRTAVLAPLADTGSAPEPAPWAVQAGRPGPGIGPAGPTTGAYRVEVGYRVDVPSPEQALETAGALLSAGAAEIPYVVFEPRDASRIEEALVEEATRAALRRARAMARTMGRELGQLRSLGTTDFSSMVMPYPGRFGGVQFGRGLIPGEIRMQATVSGSWELGPRSGSAPPPG